MIEEKLASKNKYKNHNRKKTGKCIMAKKKQKEKNIKKLIKSIIALEKKNKPPYPENKTAEYNGLKLKQNPHKKGRKLAGV